MKVLEQDIIKFIKDNNLICEGDKILVALSGGPDSVFLLNFLNKRKKYFNIKLIAAHVNHLLRGERANQDALFCKRLCDAMNIKFYSSEIDVKSFAKKNKASLEEGARILRYNELGKCANENNCNKIATAHTINDNAETMLLNIIKGTGLNGVCGIPIIRDNIIRPLLCVEKNDILSALKNAKIRFRIDESNEDEKYERNYIRRSLIPLIKKLNPSLEKTLLNSSFVFRSIKKIVDDKIKLSAKDIVKLGNDEMIINLALIDDNFEEYAGELSRRFIKKKFNLEPTYKDVVKIIKLVYNQKGRKAELSGGLEAVRESDRIIVRQKKTSDKYKEIKFSFGESINLDGKTIRVDLILKKETVFQKGKEFINADNLSGEFVLRRWRAGDKFIPLGMKSFKKVSDFLSDAKIDSTKKKDQLALIDKGNIIWLVGLRIDERYKITDKAKTTAELCLTQTMTT